MATSAYVTTKLVIRGDGTEFSAGTGDIPLTLALTASGGIDRRRFDVANAATATLWDASVSPSGSFKLLALLSDQTVLLEFQGTTVADNGHWTLYANLPLLLGSDATLAYNAASFTGAAQVFKKVLAKNSSGSTALIQCFVCE